MSFKPLISACAALLLVSAAHAEPTPDAYGAPAAGTYKLDLAHASVNFRVSHLSFSNWTARFTKFDATLTGDPANPAASQITATIDASSLQTNYPLPDLDFDKQLTGEGWLEADKYPTMTFRSTKVDVTGPKTAKVTGDFTMHGVTRPVTLDVTYNGGYGGHPYDPNSRIGFSAHGVIKRSDFGVSQGIPAPGSIMGVGDAVEVIIEAEFTGPKGKP
ncbi:MAG TPA: YceI family protein [Caulobacteraceae bacterium]